MRNPGVLASVAASVLFSVLFLIPPLLHPLSPDAVYGWRVVLSLAIVSAVLFALGRQADVAVLVVRARRERAVAAILVIDAALLAVQLWLFSWTPATGHGLEAALGYLLLPLVMVVVGLLGHRERLSLWRIAAVLAAGVGVVAALVGAGGVSWVTAVIALGYPLYFTLRRRWKLDSFGALWAELLLMTPVAVWFVLQPDDLSTVAATPQLWFGIAALGLVGGTALMLYLFASLRLSFAVFGLLTYLEPVLLVVVAVVFLREPLQPADGIVYGPIAVALLLLAVDSARQVRQKRR
jgi:chloramphenicol-sensitive protein RarD